MENDLELFKGMKLSNLMEEIVDNSREKKQQIDVLISDVRTFIKGPNDALTIVPLIRDYIDVGVKNDEQLVKLLAIAQRIMGSKQSNVEDGGSFTLSDEERKQLEKEIEEMKKEEKNILDKSKSISSKIEEIK